MNTSAPAVLLPQPVLMLPAPDDRRLVSTIINETIVDVAQVAALEHRRHRFLQKMRARIYVRAHIIDLEPVRREILVKLLRERFGPVKCARWGVADRATHELLLKIASPDMIKETKYQNHLQLAEAKAEGVAPTERAYLDWVDEKKRERKRKKKTEQPQPPSDSDDVDDEAGQTAGVPVTKIEFQRLVDELQWSVPMPTDKDPVLRIQTPHQERFPEKVGVMIFIQADDRPPGLTRDVHQLGLVTGYDALAVAIRAYLKERKAYARNLRNLHQRGANRFLRGIKAEREKRVGLGKPEPEPAPYTQEEIDTETDESQRIIMQVLNEAHAKEQAQRGFTSEAAQHEVASAADDAERGQAVEPD